MTKKNTLKMGITNILMLLSVVALLLLTTTITARADDAYVVEPSGKTDYTDTKTINEALTTHSVVQLKSGEQYYLYSPLYMKSNRTLIATGATIVSDKDAISAEINNSKTNYNNLENVVVQGGTWKSPRETGNKKTAFSFLHANNVKLLDMDIQSPSYDGHAVELVGCKNVIIDNIIVTPQGAPKKSQEVMVQIDIATNATFPRAKGTKSSNGAICKNIVVKNSIIRGNRAVATGYDYAGQGFKNKLHTNISLLNNTLISENGEGAFLVNVKNATVEGNTIISNYKKTSADKSTGLHYLMVAKAKNTSLLCRNNEVRGGKYAIRAYSQGGKKLAKVTIQKNKCYCRKGKKNAIKADKKGIKKTKISANSLYKWK